MESTKEKKAWATVMKGKRFLNAFRGVQIVIATTRHFMVHLFFAALSIVLGFYFCISEMEWIALVFAIGLVI
ncbi:MAG: diacylglycerol kinase family protein, partial [Candidatus Magasanikiibacteriota bacterium]